LGLTLIICSSSAFTVISSQSPSSTMVLIYSYVFRLLTCGFRFYLSSLWWPAQHVFRLCFVLHPFNMVISSTSQRLQYCWNNINFSFHFSLHFSFHL
jgi:hypothetical protein